MLNFDYTNADTYSRDTGGQPLPTVESIYALHDQKYFEYVPWRGRMSEFWDSKWLAWDITRSEYKLAGGSKAGLLGYGNRLDNSKENLVAATFPFLGQPPGVWSVCLGEKGALEGKEGTRASSSCRRWTSSTTTTTWRTSTSPRTRTSRAA